MFLAATPKNNIQGGGALVRYLGVGLLATRTATEAKLSGGPPRILVKLVPSLGV